MFALINFMTDDREVDMSATFRNEVSYVKDENELQRILDY